jgi:hypothetical protein
MRAGIFKSIYGLAFLGAFILLVPTFLNGYPIFYPDSSTYVRGPDYAVRKIVSPRLATVWSNVEVAGDKNGSSETKSETGKTILSGRSVYYGILVYLGYILSDFWLTAFLQAYFVAAAIGLLFFRCWQIPGNKKYFLTIALLTVLTPLGFFVGFMMPDIFASIAILAMTIAFAYWQRLTRFDVVFLSALLILSFAAHSSHVAVAVAMLPLLGLVVLLTKEERAARIRALGLIISCLAAAGVMELAFYQVTTKVTGRPPLRLPYLTARIIELGPGLRYLDKVCQPPQYTVCAFRDRLPTYWTAFMFDTDAQRGIFAPASFSVKRKLSEEQGRFALNVFLSEPAEVGRGLIYDFGNQLTRFSFSDQKMTSQFAEYLTDNYPAGVSERIKSSNIYRYPQVLQNWSTLNYGIAILAVVVAGFGLLKLRAQENDANGAFAVSAWVIGSGILANAFVCSVLASPLDRFQARVIWLLPLLALGIWFTNQRQVANAVDTGGAVKIPLTG